MALPQIVICSDSDDAHIPLVQKHLDHAPIVIGSDNLLKAGEVSYCLKDGDLTTSCNGQRLDRVKSVWYRKPYSSLVDQLAVPSRFTAYCRSAIQEHLDVLKTQFQDALWVSDFYAIHRASYKPLQLILAKRLGFRVPETLFTSCKKMAQNFIDTHDATIIKTPARAFPASDKPGLATGIFARRVERTQQINLSGLHLAPAIFQEAIDTAFDIRVTVVDNRVFAAAITVSGQGKAYENVRDWRLGHVVGKLCIEPFTLPSAIADKCVAHVKELGLRFGAIDLVMDTKGNIWFLENNPNGQWAFVEDETGQPIGKALAELLMSGLRA